MSLEKVYDPQIVEADIYALWEKSGVFEAKLRGSSELSSPSANSAPPMSDEGISSSYMPYSIVMPPPNANGNLHIGHGLTIALEDILARYYRMHGHDTVYIPGADHAGFETWVVYEKNLEKIGKSRFDYTRDELYAQVWDFVADQRGNMEIQLRAMGAGCDWSHLTFTLDPKVVQTVYQTFRRLWEDGKIYRDKKLVNYCTKHQTAFADIEVHYEDRTTPLYYLKYGPFILATTRPETKFGDTAVAVNPNDPRYQEYIGQTIEVEGVNGPFKVRVIADDYVDQLFGTGVVKITPAHDFNDWEVGLRHGLEVKQVIDQHGRLTELAGRFQGLTVDEGRAAVVAAMQEKGLIDHIDEHYQTRVGVCYKCGTVIEPMLMDQWFVDVKPLAIPAVEALEQGKIKFFPEQKQHELITYLNNLRDWNISRQIPWGIPIPVFQNPDDPSDWIYDERVDQAEIELNGKLYRRDEDTFDTWFSSGQWPFVTTDALGRGELAKYYPLSVMETGADLLYPWVSRMIMLGLYATGEVPFKEVYLHGMVLDPEGQKMSKSKGNVVNPLEIIANYGSDAFRFGIISARSAGQPQAFSLDKVLAGRNLCNKLWNLARYVASAAEQGATADQSPKTATEAGKPSEKHTSPMADNAREGVSPSNGALYAIPEESLYQGGSDAVSEEVRSGEHSDEETAEPKVSDVVLVHPHEHWIISKLEQADADLAKLMASYRFAEAAELIYTTIWNEFADWFIEAGKATPNPALLRYVLLAVLRLSHPFLPFVTEAIWQSLEFTDTLLADEQQSKYITYDMNKVKDFTKIQKLITEIRFVEADLPDQGKYTLLYGEDPLIAANLQVIGKLARLPEIKPGAGQGLRLANSGREAWLDVPPKVIEKYAENLRARLDATKQEIEHLEARLANESYLKKAPESLVEESRAILNLKRDILARLERQVA